MAAGALAGLAGLLAAYVLTTWYFLDWRWGTLGPNYLPMAPSTAWMVLLLSAGILPVCGRPGHRGAERIAYGTWGLVGAICLPALVPGGLGLLPALEQGMTPPIDLDLGVPLGRISPLTAAALLTLVAALALGLTRPGMGQACRRLAALMVAFILMSGVGVAYGYAAGAPPFYHQSIIPVAFITSVAIVLLSAALLALAGPRAWPLSILASPDPLRASAQRPKLWEWTPLTAFTFLLAAILTIGLFVLRSQVQHVREAVEEGLSTVADLKVNQIAGWHRQQQFLAEVIQQTPLPRRLILNFLSRPSDGESPQDLLDLMAAWQRINRYACLSIFDLKGRRRLAWPPDGLHAPPPSPEILRWASSAQGVYIQDLHRDPPETGGHMASLHLTLWVTITDPADSRESARGLLCLDSDAEQFLFPLVQSWPTPSESAETLLVRREGDEVVFLTELRHRDDPALTLRIPLDTAGRLPAALAVTGHSGLTEGLDYRGVPVLAATRPVPGTPWFMVAKIDQREVFAPLRERALLVGSLLMIVVLAASLGVKLVWRRREKDWLHEQLMAEKRQQVLAQRIQHLNRFANDIIMMVDRQGRILEANQRAEETYGYPPDGMSGLSFTGLFPPAEQADDQPPAFDLGGRTGQIYEAVHRRRDGSLFPVEISSRVVELDQVEYILAIIRDIGERKRAEQEKLKLEAQIRQAQKMEAVGTLAGGIAHDFNNLLTIIMGFAEISLAKRQEGGGDTDGIPEIIEAAERARSLVRQLMSFSRAQQGETRPLDLNEIVQQTADLLRRTLLKTISLETRLETNVYPVLGDPNQMEQILLNLATNAQDAMPQGGRVLMATRNVELDTEFTRLHPGLHPGPHVLLQFSDSGPGMDERTRERIFDPFFTTKEAGKGTGLGLSTVYGIVKNHNGYVSCYSDPGRGTTFNIYLPLRRQDESSLPLEVVAPGNPDLRGSEAILLVDDEAPLRKMGSVMLESMGYRVTLAASGEEALETYRRLGKELDLVVLDLGMPGMGGERCLRELLALNPRVKVVVASGYAFEHTVRDALAAGAGGFVAKPFLRTDLLGTVRAVLERDAGEPPRA